jgi:hypothetical protein
VKHWSDGLFSIKGESESAFRFENGHFIMVGLEVNGKPAIPTDTNGYILANIISISPLSHYGLGVPHSILILLSAESVPQPKGSSTRFLLR